MRLTSALNMPPVGPFINAGAEPERLRAVLSEWGQDLAGDKAALNHRIEELRRLESGLTRLGGKLKEDDDALESVLTELREVKARRRVKEDTRERLHSEFEDEALRVGRIEATIAAVEEASSVSTLDYSGRRQALSDLGVRVAVYSSWHEPPYRRVMSAVEMKDGGGRRLWVDGEALNRVSVAASPSHRRAGSRVDRRGRGRHECGTQRPVPVRWTSDDTEPREAA